MSSLRASSDANVGVRESHVFQESFVVLAHPWFLVVASDVVPVDSVFVELVQNCQAVFWGSTLDGFAVVRLGFVNSEQFQIVIINYFIFSSINYITV